MDNFYNILSNLISFNSIILALMNEGLFFHFEA